MVERLVEPVTISTIVRPSDRCQERLVLGGTAGMGRFAVSQFVSVGGAICDQISSIHEECGRTLSFPTCWQVSGFASSDGG
jgi:hypothetical protein